MVRVRARNVVELRELVSKIRAKDSVTGTKTRIIAGRWWHGTTLDQADEAKGLARYRYGDSNPGFRTENPAS
jgi:hypothetical protein